MHAYVQVFSNEVYAITYDDDDDDDDDPTKHLSVLKGLVGVSQG